MKVTDELLKRILSGIEDIARFGYPLNDQGSDTTTIGWAQSICDALGIDTLDHINKDKEPFHYCRDFAHHFDGIDDVVEWVAELRK